jgi:hypothetical protein
MMFDIQAINDPKQALSGGCDRFRARASKKDRDTQQPTEH